MSMSYGTCEDCGAEDVGLWNESCIDCWMGRIERNAANDPSPYKKIGSVRAMELKILQKLNSRKGKVFEITSKAPIREPFLEIEIHDSFDGGWIRATHNVRTETLQRCKLTYPKRIVLYGLKRGRGNVYWVNDRAAATFMNDVMAVSRERYLACRASLSLSNHYPPLFSPVVEHSISVESEGELWIGYPRSLRSYVERLSRNYSGNWIRIPEVNHSRRSTWTSDLMNEVLPCLDIYIHHPWPVDEYLPIIYLPVLFAIFEKNPSLEFEISFRKEE